MRRISLSLRRVCEAIAMAIALVGSVYAATPPDPNFTVYPIPGARGAVAGITVGPDGALWFTTVNSIWRITTRGVMTQYPLPDDGNFYSGGRFATDITAGPDGALWFTEVNAAKIGRITTDGTIAEFPLPATDRAPVKIAVGSDGALWFTEFINTQGRIGRITTDGVISEYAVAPCQGTCGRYPNGITSGPDGALWFTDLGDDRLHSITTEGVIRDYGLVALNSYGYAPGDITPGPDGALWFTGQGNTDALGRITTSGGLTLFPLPIYPRPDYNGYNNLEPNSITVGPDGALWFTAQRVNVLGRMTTQGDATFYALPLPANAGTASSITLGPDRALWIGSNGCIIRAVLADTIPPHITLSASPLRLWPSNDRLAGVRVWGQITDLESGLLDRSIEFAVTDEYGEIQPTGHIVLDATGHYTFQVLLRASRRGWDKDGRRYMIRVSARDNAGNRGANWKAVIVPHDLR